MPGMMDTVLNLGLNDETAAGLAAQTGDPRFAYDAYRRFVAMFGTVVMGVDGARFEHALDRAKEAAGAQRDTDLSAGDLRQLVAGFKRLVFAEQHGAPFPDDPAEQLRMTIAAVFDSWDNPRARAYRRVHRIADDIGTGVTVQAMVFGNRGWDSGTGVAFTRDPSTGEKTLFGEYLLNAQGEDVVAGTRTPRPIAEMEADLPDAFRQFREIAGRLERTYGDVQDVEFTVEQGRLWLLQTRTAKRSGASGRQGRRGHGGRGRHRPGDGAPPRLAGRARQPAAPDRRPRRPGRGAGGRAAREPWRRPGPRRVHVRRRRGAAPPRASRWSWSATRPRPTTSTAWWPPSPS